MRSDHIFHLLEDDAREDFEYGLTFLATGCPNQYPWVEWWKTQPDQFVLNDMFEYCRVVSNEIATDKQTAQCCGSYGISCKPSSCIKQQAWKSGIIIFIKFFFLL